MKYFHIVFCTLIAIKFSVSLNYGNGDWSIYEHWLTNDQSCYNFIDSQPYDLARIRLQLAADGKSFDFGIKINIQECIQLASLSEKKVILHSNRPFTEKQLENLGIQLGETGDDVWLFYELPLNWTGHLYIKPVKTVILGLDDHPGYKYTQSDLEIFQQRLSQFNSPTKKGIELNSDLVKRSANLDWKPLIDEVDYTIIYKDNKTGEVKNVILDIIRSPIHATIWDTEKLDSYGTSMKLQWWPEEVLSKMLKRTKN